ncbi:MAG: hypothetical protein KIT11_03105 [Fimbriimonadaceae bacterium]|nr:hypothetical protein [Fimbriimonadaceae bacterium]QYK57114.1 MAG: hypothetical protein KF733_06420 [Fimbriimonadaceae bacterium]
MQILGSLFAIVSLVCSIIILIDAFKSAIWKGIVGILCGLYLLYYGIVEFKHPNKTVILAVWLISAILGGGLSVMSSSGRI